MLLLYLLGAPPRKHPKANIGRREITELGDAAQTIDAYRNAARRIEKHCAAEQLIAYLIAANFLLTGFGELSSPGIRTVSKEAVRGSASNGVNRGSKRNRVAQ